MRGIVMGAVLLPAAALAATGCATRDWVRELVGTKEVEFDQRLGEQSQRVEGMGFRLKTVEGGLGETGELARGARERAEAEHARAEDVDKRLTRLWSSRHKRDLVETLELRFGFDRWDLNDVAQTSLATLVGELHENPRLSVDLEGYADPAGTYDYNVALSQRRVEAVRRYLVEKGVELPRIHLVGLGPLTDPSTPDEQKRRVTVRLLVASD
jgi:outer membrane protein OmpA-like peptidoglycan-associated protein